MDDNKFKFLYVLVHVQREHELDRCDVTVVLLGKWPIVYASPLDNFYHIQKKKKERHIGENTLSNNPRKEESKATKQETNTKDEKNLHEQQQELM